MLFKRSYKKKLSWKKQLLVHVAIDIQAAGSAYEKCYRRMYGMNEWMNEIAIILSAFENRPRAGLV